MKKALKIIVSVIAWIILIFALILTILVFSADKNNGISCLFGYIPLTVESDSMSPTFSKDDLILDKEIDDVHNLQEGDVITFRTLIDGQRVNNTHRIIAVNKINGNISFTTKGDNNDVKDSLEVYTADIIGKWNGTKINGFGKVMNFLKTRTGFCICVIVPMGLFFLFELYKLIVVIVEIKRPAAAKLDEEAIKRKAIEEYLAEQQQKTESNSENKSDEKDENNGE